MNKQVIYDNFAFMQNNLVIGRNAVMELLDSGRQIEKIYLQTGIRGEFEKDLRQKLKGRQIPLQYVPSHKINKMTKGLHQGILAFIALVEYQSAMDVVSQLYELGESPFLIILDGVTDVRNFGAIARSAEVLGAHAIICPTKNSAIINEITFKSSAGALAHITVCREKSLVNTINDLKSMGIRIFAANHLSEQSIENIDFQGPCAVVFGDEGEGVSNSIMRLTDQTFKINQIGKTESLNVSVAAGVVLYEISKSRI